MEPSGADEDLIPPVGVCVCGKLLQETHLDYDADAAGTSKAVWVKFDNSDGHHYRQSSLRMGKLELVGSGREPNSMACDDFKPGDAVRHKTHGRGVVSEVAGSEVGGYCDMCDRAVAPREGVRVCVPCDFWECSDCGRPQRLWQAAEKAAEMAADMAAASATTATEAKLGGEVASAILPVGAAAAEAVTGEETLAGAGAGAGAAGAAVDDELFELLLRGPGGGQHEDAAAPGGELNGGSPGVAAGGRDTPASAQDGASQVEATQPAGVPWDGLAPDAPPLAGPPLAGDSEKPRRGRGHGHGHGRAAHLAELPVTRNRSQGRGHPHGVGDGGQPGASAEGVPAVPRTLTEAELKSGGTVRLHIVRAENLPAVDKGGTSDPYVRCKMLGKRRRVKTIKCSLAPEWNQTLDFPFRKFHKDLTPTTAFHVQVGAVHA